MKKVFIGILILVMLLSACGRKESDTRAVEKLNKEIELHHENNDNIFVKVITKDFTNECFYVDGITYCKVNNDEYYDMNDITYKRVNNVWEEVEYNKYLDAVCNIDLLFHAELVDYKETKENITISGEIEEKYLQMILPEANFEEKVKITYTYTLDGKLVDIKIRGNKLDSEFNLSFENVTLPEYVPTE